jgi:hypothetical protein
MSALGFYTHPDNLSAALAQVGGKAAILNEFFGAEAGFPKAFADWCATLGAVPLVTVQPGAWSLASIVLGTYDAEITAWATAAKDDGRPVYLRFAHEMNGDWYPWGYPSNPASEYVAAWRHVVDLFRAAGAANVQFVWCVATGGDMATTVIGELFPGDDYVDWVSMDGYNRNVGGVWQSFRSIFDSGYELLTTLSTKPIIIAETASVEDPARPHHKAGWITRSFLDVIPTYPRIEAVCYFSAPGHGNYDYAWDSSSEALSAIQAVFAK